MNQKLAAYLATGRVSNLPTVWCNVFMAWCLLGTSFSGLSLPMLVIASSLFYLGGCYLGDAADINFDRQHKPDRPIPSGLISARTIWLLGIAMFIGAFFLSSLILEHTTRSLLLSLPLAACIICYALWHKKSPLIGLPLIGGCRLLLVTTALFYASGWSSIAQASWQHLLVAFSVGLYTICFASVARSESSPQKVSFPNLLKLVMLILPASVFLLPVTSPLTYICYGIYVAWLLLAFRFIQINKGRYVSFCLAGFALLDTVFLSTTSLTNIAIGLVLFCFALFLQKFTPAT